jgi:GT2 family glycosyltransferase
MSEIRLLCVHYSDHERVVAFAHHLNTLPLPPGWILRGGICDNSLNWPDSAKLPDNFRVHTPPSNLGYLPGSAAANVCWESEGVADWTAIINTDLEFGQDFFLQLAQTQWEEDILAVGPDLRLRNNTRQNPFFATRPARKKLELYRFLFGNPLRSRFMEEIYRLRRAGKTPPEPEVITAPFVLAYALHGAATFLHRRYFEQGGSITYPSFMYGEEIFFAEEVRKLDGRMVWIPEAIVWHDAGATTSGNAQIARRAQWQHQSLSLLLERYF